VHEHSQRKGEFVAVNLAALPETIVESEIFGHERGAFTGAAAKREGRIAQARGGTLFLDEIGELSQHVQVKLLRVLQEGEYEPLGGRTEKADFRLIAATNRDLAKEVAEGRFREDLFYRLNVIAITCPPLRDRNEDVPLLVDHFVEVYCRKNNRETLRVSREVLDRLSGHSWPGNVRELENVIERAVVLCTDSVLRESDLPEPIARATPMARSLSFAIGTPLEEIERRVIQATLEHTSGDKRLAAQLLGIATRTIYRKLDAQRDGESDEDSPLGDA
jgi:two-component system response regulator HydG